MSATCGESNAKFVVSVQRNVWPGSLFMECFGLVDGDHSDFKGRESFDYSVICARLRTLRTLPEDFGMSGPQSQF
jgi:hypothetical protein